MLVLTNNKSVTDFLKKHDEIRHELRWVEGKTEDVLKIARDMCHINWKILTHPLSGSVKPNQTPYKTIVMEECTGGCDLQSVIMTEEAYNRTLTMLADRPRPFISEKILEDLAVVDLDLFKSHLRNVNLY